MAIRRDAVNTPVAADDVYNGLTAAWRTCWIEDPKPESVCVPLAQWALETGRGKSCFNFNLGNSKSREGDGYDFTFFRTTENLSLRTANALLAADDNRIRVLSKDTSTARILFLPDHPGCRFRAFPTLTDGCDDYLRLLHMGFFAAWSSVLVGDARRFARDLKRARYYTADEKPYGDALASLTAEFSRTFNRNTGAMSA